MAKLTERDMDVIGRVLLAHFLLEAEYVLRPRNNPFTGLPVPSRSKSCYSTPSGLRVHVKPGCRCGNASDAPH
jgi:hypothetical protein